jgi:hypothetical protein
MARNNPVLAHQGINLQLMSPLNIPEIQKYILGMSRGPHRLHKECQQVLFSSYLIYVLG